MEPVLQTVASLVSCDVGPTAVLVSGADLDPSALPRVAAQLTDQHPDDGDQIWLVPTSRRSARELTTNHRSVYPYRALESESGELVAIAFGRTAVSVELYPQLLSSELRGPTIAIFSTVDARLDLSNRLKEGTISEDELARDLAYDWSGCLPFLTGPAATFATQASLSVYHGSVESRQWSEDDRRLPDIYSARQFAMLNNWSHVEISGFPARFFGETPRRESSSPSHARCLLLHVDPGYVVYHPSTSRTYRVSEDLARIVEGVLEGSIRESDLDTSQNQALAAVTSP